MSDNIKKDPDDDDDYYKLVVLLQNIFFLYNMLCIGLQFIFFIVYFKRVNIALF